MSSGYSATPSKTRPWFYDAHLSSNPRQWVLYEGISFGPKHIRAKGRSFVRMYHESFRAFPTREKADAARLRAIAAYDDQAHLRAAERVANDLAIKAELSAHEARMATYRATTKAALDALRGGPSRAKARRPKLELVA